MRVKWKIAFGLYCVAVLYLSSLPAKELPDQTAMVPDKVLHMIEYALMGILAWGSVRNRWRKVPLGLIGFLRMFWDRG